MSTKNLFAIGLALVAELCASGGSGFLTLCVHEDGTARYEPTMALCCNEGEQGQSVCRSHEGAEPTDGREVVPEDSCQDYGVVFSQVPTSPSSAKEILSGGPVICELLPAVTPTPGMSIVPLATGIGGCGPPQSHILQELSTIVLRI